MAANEKCTTAIADDLYEVALQLYNEFIRGSITDFELDIFYERLIQAIYGSTDDELAHVPFWLRKIS